MLGKLFKISFKVVLGIVLFVLLYLAAAFTIPTVAVNSDFSPCKKDAIEIFILTNGVHTDIVAPLKNDIMDWTKLVDPGQTSLKDTVPAYAAFGWGDKGFYLETPTWSQLKFSTAFKACFFLSTSAMHVTFHKDLKESASCKKICISRESYAKLAGYIDKSFKRVENSVNLLRGASYGKHDLFYDGEGTYNLFFTCNTWANSGLKAAELKACLWTPFQSAIFSKYE